MKSIQDAIKETKADTLKPIVIKKIRNDRDDGRYDRREGEFRRGDPGHPDNEMGM